jgi:acid phosphatase type 7
METSLIMEISLMPQQLLRRSKLGLLSVLFLISLSTGAQEAKHSTNADLPPLWQLGGHPAPGANTRENQPFKVYLTQPVMVHGPLIVDPTETMTTIEWITDTPCTARIVYGEDGRLDHVAEPQENGMLPVAQVHRIDITGLLPGHTYSYRLESTRVVRLKPYEPDMGETLQSPIYTFTTFDSAKSVGSFNTITDTHGMVDRIQAVEKVIDWKNTDFLVHTGDGVNWVDSEDQIFGTWLDPIGEALHQEKPLIYARGNHDLRGPFARELVNYLGTSDRKFYFSRDDGPLHLIVIDTAEDKPDETKAYSGLLRQKIYRQEELDWFRNHLETDARAKQAPFRVVVMHQPDWGWLDQKNNEWTEPANQGNVDLVIAGHFHHFVHFEVGVAGTKFPVLAIAPDQSAHVEATRDLLKVTVVNVNGKIDDTFTIPRHAN